MPVSGAVVLENQQQFKAAGLEPVDSSSVPTVPTVPEPETWALMIVVAAVIGVVIWKKRRRAGRAA